MKCAITGATGHIGSALARQLCQQNHHVTALVMPGDSTRPLTGLPVDIRWGNVLSPSSLEESFCGAKVVYHLAGIVDIGSGNRKTMYQVNVNGTQNVLQACRDQGVQRLVYVSSVHAIAEHSATKPITETAVFDPALVKGEYAKTKAIATAIMLEASAHPGLEIIIVHPSGVIGPYEYSLSNMGQMVLDYMRGTLSAYVEGAYDFVDVRDVADGICKAGEKGCPGQCYILSGHWRTVKQMLDTLSEVTGRRPVRTKLPMWFAMAAAPLAELYYMILRQKPLYTRYSMNVLQSNGHFSAQKAMQELGYSARSFEQTMRDTAQWLIDQQFLPPRKLKKLSAALQARQ